MARHPFLVDAIAMLIGLVHGAHYKAEEEIRKESKVVAQDRRISSVKA